MLRQFRECKRKGQMGFSLVELLVALVFTLLLMAGMATVFQGSLSTFVTSGEKLSSARRNRMSVDMIYDDLNAAGMLLTSLSNYSGGTNDPITLNPINPAFRITPNVPYLGTDIAAPNNVGDQLDLYFDEALPFEGRVGVQVEDSGQMVWKEKSLDDAGVGSRSITLDSSAQGSVVASENLIAPLRVIYRANIQHPPLPMGLSVAGNIVTASMSVDPTSESSATTEFQIPAGTRVLFVKRGRYIRYSIQSRNLDPDPANVGTQVPCLVRDEVIYDNVSGSGTPFAAPISSTIIAENVVGFQVMVSPDGGNTWVNNPYDPAQRAGGPPSAAAPGLPHTIHAGWDAVRGLLNLNASITGRPAPNNVVDDSRFWFKNIPVLVRVDITTRTARPRSEYLQNRPDSIVNSTGPAPYKIQTQSVVIVPRHFGLAYDIGLM